MKYGALYRLGADRLTAAGIEEAALDARLLLESVCHTDRNTLLVHGDTEVEQAQEQRYLDGIKARACHVPLQYITGVQEFMGLSFAVNEHVLIPRQDTEILVEEAMRELHDGMRILDMCTGSGCILLSLLRYSNDCAGTGVDISAAALAVAAGNAAALGLEADFREGDLFAGLERGSRFDMLVSNPPYIRTDVIPGLMEEVRLHEPLSALDGTADGLEIYRRISREAKPYLNGGAGVFLEIGFDQGADVRRILEDAGYDRVEIVKDYAGHDRVVRCIWQEKENV